MILKKKTDYFAIGKNGTVSEFRAANQKALGKRHPNEAQWELERGAIEAFRAGNPEIIQTILSNTKEFEIKYKASWYNREINLADVLLKLTEGKDDPSAVIDLAFAKKSEQSKQTSLNYALNDAVTRGVGGESFYAALLKSGANANVPSTKGFAGIVLVNAVVNKRPLSVIKLLYDNGASFDDARLLVQSDTKFWGAESVESLNAYQEKISGKPDVADTDQFVTEEVLPRILETMMLMQEQIQELTEKVDRLSSPAAPDPKASQQENAKTQPKKSPYLSLQSKKTAPPPPR